MKKDKLASMFNKKVKNRKPLSLKKFNTKQEKDALLVDDDKPLSEIVKILAPYIEVINEYHAEYLLYKLRETSVSETFELIVNCPKCEAINTFNIEISEFLDERDYPDIPIPFGFYNSVEDLLTEKEIEELSWNEYDNLEQLIFEYSSKIKSTKRNCRKCNNELDIEVNIRNLFSKDSIKSIYKVYTDLMMFTNNGILDIDSMYPFEREIYVNLVSNAMKQEG